MNPVIFAFKLLHDANPIPASAYQNHPTRIPVYNDRSIRKGDKWIERLNNYWPETYFTTMNYRLRLPLLLWRYPASQLSTWRSSPVLNWCVLENWRRTRSSSSAWETRCRERSRERRRTWISFAVSRKGIRCWSSWFASKTPAENCLPHYRSKNFLTWQRRWSGLTRVSWTQSTQGSRTSTTHGGCLRRDSRHLRQMIYQVFRVLNEWLDLRFGKWFRSIKSSK